MLIVVFMYNCFKMFKYELYSMYEYSIMLKVLCDLQNLYAIIFVKVSLFWLYIVVAIVPLSL